MMKVFLSSTYADLIEYREKAVEALERLNLQVRRMESFGARPTEPSNACLSEIEDCDLFVGIYAHRYGYIPAGSSVSITEAELRHAKKHNKPIFCFVVEDKYSWSPEMIERGSGKAKLKALKAEICSSFTKDTFTIPDNLASRIATSIGRYVMESRASLVPPPQMEIVGHPSSFFGRLDSSSGPFALLLQVKFHNKSMQPALLEAFRIYYANSWHVPHPRMGNVSLYVSTFASGRRLSMKDDITEALRIPEMGVEQRHAFFILPNPPEPFPGPERLDLTAEATFVQRSLQPVAFTLTYRGEIEQEGGLGNQEAR